MRIIIVGGGKIGLTLSEQLTAEHHDVTVIDNNEAKLTSISNTLDVICYAGNGASYTTLREAGAADADLLIAVTGGDECNMLCCLIAHKLGARHTVARVRSPEYFDQLAFLKDDLGLSMVINPELAAAQDISRVLRFPSATRVELFARGRAELVSSRLRDDSPLCGMRLSDMRQKFSLRVLVCAVERDGEVVIPSGDFVLAAGDLLYFTGATDDMTRVFKKTHLLTGRIHDAMIAGGSRIAYYLAQILLKSGISVKLIERDKARAAELSAQLAGCSVLCGDASDHELLLAEGLLSTDAFVALTGLDEGNILSALFAHRKGVKKIVAKVNNAALVPLVGNLGGLESVISPKQIAANHILRYVRAMNAGKVSTSSVESLYRIADGRVEVLEFAAVAGASFLNVPLAKLNFKRGVLVAAIIREGRVIIPGGADVLMPSDSVLIVTATQHPETLSDVLE